MVKKDFKSSRVQHRAKQSSKLDDRFKAIRKWQKKLEKDYALNFVRIANAISKLPTEEGVKNTIVNTVNGKIDALKKDVVQGIEKIDLVGEHLKRQDETAELHGVAIEEIRAIQEEQGEQIKPWNKTYIFGVDAVKVIVYLGTVAGALAAIFGFLYLVGWLKQ